jgi:hypothetical protein
MYEGSFEEAANYIWAFIFKQNLPKWRNHPKVVLVFLGGLGRNRTRAEDL